MGKQTTDIIEKIGFRIQTIRYSRKLSQQELGNRIEKSTHFISDVERGTKRPSVNTLIDIIHALDTTPNEVLCDFITFKDDTLTKIIQALSDLTEEEKQYLYKFILDYKKMINSKKL